MDHHEAHAAGLGEAKAGEVSEEAPTLDPDAIDAGRRLFTQDCVFIAGVARPDALPAGVLPEIAFAGRSNVGKSSLVNALTGRQTLARTSKAPGRTQQLNFFELGGKLVLVDMPGYGFARVGRKQIQGWSQLIRLYLKGRPNLRRALLLIDARHGLKDSDRETMTILDEAAVSYQLVLTKADKLKPDALGATCAGLREEAARHPAAHPEILATSAHDGLGIQELRAMLAAVAALG